MAAADARNQKCWIMEISPKCVDGSGRRYIKMTGSKNVKCIRNGEQLPRETIAGIFEEAESDEGGGTD